MTFSVGLKAALRGRIEDGLAAGEALAEVVVRLALELDGEPAGGEGHEGLPGRARRLEVDRVLGKALLAGAARDLVAELGAHRPVDVADRDVAPHPLAPLEGGRGQAQEIDVERLARARAPAARSRRSRTVRTRA